MSWIFSLFYFYYLFVHPFILMDFNEWVGGVLHCYFPFLCVHFVQSWSFFVSEKSLSCAENWKNYIPTVLTRLISFPSWFAFLHTIIYSSIHFSTVMNSNLLCISYLSWIKPSAFLSFPCISDINSKNSNVKVGFVSCLIQSNSILLFRYLV